MTSLRTAQIVDELHLPCTCLQTILTGKNTVVTVPAIALSINDVTVINNSSYLFSPFFYCAHGDKWTAIALQYPLS